MKRIVSSLIIVLFVLALLSPVSAGTNSSVQLTSDEMGQITGGMIRCGGYEGMACCCVSLWIFEFCVCVG